MIVLTLKGLGDWRTLTELERFDVVVPKVLASSNPGLKLANAFGVFKLNQYQNVGNLEWRNQGCRKFLYSM